MSNQAGSIIILISMKSFAKPHQKIWRVKTPAPVLCQIFARKLDISPVTAQLLINRGIYTVEQGRAFIGSELSRLHRPELLRDMDTAVARILQAVEAGEKILIYGDYDADGITATALLIKVFRRLGADADYYIPGRLEEGYGVHLEPLQKALQKGTGLVVTVDCGISALAEAEWARANGLDLIITDHHEPPPEIPNACAVINPKRPDCSYPFKELAGVGLALKLAQALLERTGAGEKAWLDYLDLACLGTVADIVPVQGENRILVKHGLPRLAGTGSPGLQALMAVSGIKGDNLSPREVGYALAPRLNAAGRIGTPQMGVRLLMTDDLEEARHLAGELNRYNQVRQKIESKVFEEALSLLEADPGLAEAPVPVLASPGWHAGVIGIVASRLAEKLYRPVLLISLEGELGRGSARSIPGFNVYKALSHCHEYLLEYGGHALAAGFKVEGGMVEDLRKKINGYARTAVEAEKLIPYLELDGIVEVGQVSEELVNEIKLLSPFGPSNPDPLLCCLEAFVLESRVIGKGSSHLKLRLRGKNTVMDGIGFNLGAYAEVLATAEKVDLAFVPGINEYNGRRSLQLEVKDLGIPAVLDLTGGIQEGAFSGGIYPVPAGEPGGDKEELFVPEFVLKALYGREWPEKEILPEKIQDVDVADCRGSADRPGSLARLAEQEEPTLVITSCGYQTIELFHYLQLSRPALKGQVAFCHGFLTGQDRSEIAEKFREGRIKTLIVTPSVARSVGPYAGQAVLYHLPFSPAEINSAACSLRPGGRLYLFFGPEDLEDNLAGLGIMAPDREYLACLYKIIRHLAERDAGQKGQTELDLSLAARILAKTGFGYSNVFAVRVALAVFEELGLLKILRKGSSCSLVLHPVSGDKKDLMESQIYRRLFLIKEESAGWMRKFLDVPLHELFSIQTLQRG